MDWEYYIAEIIKIVLGFIATVGIPYLLAILKAHINNKLAWTLVDRASVAIRDCVQFVNQTYVNGLKKEGKFDTDMQQEAFLMCKTECLKILTEETKEVIHVLCGDFDTWLSVQIESAVGTEKWMHE